MNATLEMPAPVAVAKPPQFKILLADDDRAIRQILFRLLEEEGYAVDTAANGKEAMELSRITNFDLALLDLNMPVCDGWETFEELTERQPMLPVIWITARPNQLSNVNQSAVVAVLEKPLDLAVLFSTIHNFLEEPLEVRLARAMGHPPGVAGAVKPGKRTSL